MKKTQLRKIVILLALSATPSMYASELSMTPFGVANPVRIDINFTTSTTLTSVGFASADDGSCSVSIAVSYIASLTTPFALRAPSPQAVYFNGFLPNKSADLCLAVTGGTISLDGIITNQGACLVTGCYFYTCDAINGNITSITPITAFTASCP